MKGVLFVTAVGLLLTGCASMNKDECLSANWHDIGYEDGLKGSSRNHLADHRKACAEYQVTPDSKAYYDGFEQGVRLYCTPANGLAVGQRGGSYNMQSCPTELEPAFLKQYDYGRKLHKVHQDITDTKSKISNQETALEKENDPKVRKALRSEIDALYSQRRTLESEESLLRENPPK